MSARSPPAVYITQARLRPAQWDGTFADSRVGQTRPPASRGFPDAENQPSLSSKP